MPWIDVKLYDHRVNDESVPKIIEALTTALAESSGAAPEHIHVVVQGSRRSTGVLPASRVAEAGRKPVFLITGASSGIGESTARRAAEAGYRVVLAARTTEKLEALAAELGGFAVTCDVMEWTQQQAMVERTLAEYGRLDVAFANAGFGAPRGFKESTPEHWRAMVLTNVYGAALTIRACYDALVASRGHLLLTGSLAGRRALPGSLYSCTKFAISAMGEAARLELNGTGVRVTLIEPGMTDTPFFDQQPDLEALHPDDIARAVMFAVSQPPHVDVNEILVRPTAQDT
jgi:NADP-dependent 3-hydroxy acid dehydrogenase YdfG/phenylpyruvate tautomerase PptA (4-oxalocrotonate tautomerase family)